MFVQTMHNDWTAVATDVFPVLLSRFLSHRIFDVHDGLRSLYCRVFLSITEDAFEGVRNHRYDEVEDNHERNEHVGTGEQSGHEWIYLQEWCDAGVCVQNGHLEDLR